MWDVIYNPTNVRLEVIEMSVVHVPTSTTTATSTVTIWPSGKATSVARFRCRRDGDSDGADFLAWQRQFGSGAVPLAALRTVESCQSRRRFCCVGLAASCGLVARRDSYGACKVRTAAGGSYGSSVIAISQAGRRPSLTRLPRGDRLHGQLVK